ncbi:MAG: hypothetical protein KBG48_14625 [Kofleriaceae bacterium]|jgi:hypothetical protein|nr:hypothetical protein [Kofleriaceae bacterium]MBP9168627.1 hypothetical protein [Kofleriaceae bacterium]MBP9857499.1 hypothetical protein [Kofleriaceae bacterium]
MTDHATHVLDALAALRTAIAADVPEQELTPFLDVAVAIVRGEPGYDREAMVAAAAPLVADNEGGLAAALNALEGLLTSTFYDQEWRWACERRSKLEAVRTLWAEQLGGPGAPYLDCEGVDDLLRRKGDHEGGLRPEQIPPGTPTSHWWWWYPATPPA